MKTPKITFGVIAVLLLLFYLTSCKKDSAKPDDEAKPFVLTDYYIVGKYTLNGAKMPYVITFDENAKSNSITVGLNSQSSWTYTDGVLTLDYGNSVKDTFKITDGKIASFVGASKLDTYSLQKLPETNLFEGNSYSGGWITPGSNLQLVARFKFVGSKYGETSLGEPVIDKDYILIKNVAATSNTAASGILTFFAIVNGKLEAARYKTGNYTYGTFAKL